MKPFGPNDIVFNTIKAYPQSEFFIYDRKVYLNDEKLIAGKNHKTVKHIPQGYISLYELNVDRPADGLIYPFITKEGTRTAFKTVSISAFDDSSQFRYGDKISGKYPLSASLSRIFVKEGEDIKLYNFENKSSFSSVSENKKYIRSLEPVLEHYKHKSEHFHYNSRFGNKATQAVNMICIPAIFYGSEIKKKSVCLDFYISGSLTAQLQDKTGNGELIEVTGSNVGAVAGVVLYQHGILMLTGSWELDGTHTDKYNGTAYSSVKPKWIYFAAGMHSVGDINAINSLPSSSFKLDFKGTTLTPTLTMMAHAAKGEYNYSNNPTFLDKSSRGTINIRDNSVIESPSKIKNFTKSPYKNTEAKFTKSVYISKIGIFDERKNLIAIVNLSNPVKKNENRDYTFKAKLDF